MRVLGAGVAPAKGLHKGTVVDIEKTKESIRESAKMAERSCGAKIESAYVGITGRHVGSLNNRGMVAVRRGDRLVINRVLSNARTVKVPGDRRLLHVIPRGYMVDGQTGVTNPEGMHGFRLDVETHIVTAAGAAIQNLVKCIRGAGIEVDDLVLEPLASAEAVLSSDERENGVILADIGCGTTDVAVFKDGSIWHTAVVPVGGYQFTRDIAMGLGIPYNVAEELKIKYGSVKPDSARLEERIDTARWGLENGNSIVREDICEIVQARAEELLNMILVEMAPSAESEALSPHNLVLTGGTANLTGLADRAKEIFRIPARVGVPKDMYGLADILFNPAYATSVGLLLWGARHGAENNWQQRRYWENFSGMVRRLLFRMKRVFPS
jgi:cell division protein FtsA